MEITVPVMQVLISQGADAALFNWAFTVVMLCGMLGFSVGAIVRVIIIGMRGY